MRISCVNYFKYELLLQKEMPFKDISYCDSCIHLSAGQNNLYNFVSGHYREVSNCMQYGVVALEEMSFADFLCLSPVVIFFSRVETISGFFLQFSYRAIIFKFREIFSRSCCLIIVSLQFWRSFS